MNACPLAQSTANPEERRAILQRWENHEFYRSAVVLGVDVGVEGIGIWLRKGPECLFRGTFLVPLPEAAPLQMRRQLRAVRHARRARQQRDRRLKEWVVKYGLLSAQQAGQLWANPRAFERAFEHRWRAIAGAQPLASPEALVVCIRHCVRHRGYDHHILFRDENTTYPWGDDLELSKIRAWGATGVLPEEYGTELQLLIEDSSDLKESQKVEACRIIADAISRYRGDPIRRMLDDHMREKHHTNLRPAARGHNFPRELVKAHLRQICERHRHFFPPNRFDDAMRELIGPHDGRGEVYDPNAESIMDLHRRTPAEARRLWERKEGRCAVAPHLIALGHLPAGVYRRSMAGEAAIRQWRILQFLAERRVELASGARQHVTADIVREAVSFVADDAQAWAARQRRPTAPNLRRQIEQHLGRLVPTSQSSLNKDFFDQLGDLLKPSSARLRAKAPICSSAAQVLLKLATDNETDFDPERIRERLTACGYYEWRKQATAGRALYPQVDYLLGDPRQFDPQTGEPRDRRDGIPRQHGLLRRLFAGQLRLDTGELVDLRDQLDGRTVPDYVVIEAVRDMPRNTEQLRAIREELKARREERRRIAQLFGLDFDQLDDNQIRRLLLFYEQSGSDGTAKCPYTGDSLGRDPLAPALEIEHIFPQSRGGLSIMENLVITRRQTNAQKGNRTPVEWLGLDRARELAAPMRWSERKRRVFLWTSSDCPDWSNLTRTAQLARELQRRVIEWLGIERKHAHIANPTERARRIELEVRQRVATPSGPLTAACREAWSAKLPGEYFLPPGNGPAARPLKNRNNLRHHMWDAGVLANIPPGDGLNHVRCGGIFETVTVAGHPHLQPLPELAPNIAAVEAADPLRCHVHRLRQRHPRSSRTLQQPVSLPRAEGQCWQRVPIVKVVDEKNQVVKNIEPENLLDALRRAGLGPDRISDSEVKRWMNDPRPAELPPLRLRDGTPVRRLQLPLPQQKADFAAHPHITTARSAAPHAPRYYRSAKGHTKGWLIGLKGATETFDRLEIWRGPKLDRAGRPLLDVTGTPVWVYKSVAIPTARNIAAYKRMWGRPPPIHRPAGVTEKVGHIRKGDLLLVPFGPCQDGQFELAPENREPTARLWMRVRSIRASKQVELELAEYRDFSATPLRNVIPSGPKIWSPSNPETLARLLRTREHALAGRAPHP
ncbi:MAG: hypothetical protein N2652_06265 [Kiritimatiellae bacterium]|nr:hypothetical protein [Kiritimatiellia bacterium]